MKYLFVLLIVLSTSSVLGAYGETTNILLTKAPNTIITSAVNNAKFVTFSAEAGETAVLSSGPGSFGYATTRFNRQSGCGLEVSPIDGDFGQFKIIADSWVPGQDYKFDVVMAAKNSFNIESNLDNAQIYFLDGTAHYVCVNFAFSWTGFGSTLIFDVILKIYAAGRAPSSGSSGFINFNFNPILLLATFMLYYRGKVKR